MSTKVYDAYIFNGRGGGGRGLDELLESLKVIRDRYAREFKRKMIDLFSFTSSTLDDSKYYMEVAKLIMLSMEKGYNVMTNPEASAMVFPYDGRLLVKFFGLEGFSLDDERYIDYHYQDQTDMPDDMDELEWAERRDTWDKVAGSGSWQENGFSFEFIPPYFAWDVAMDVMEARKNEKK